MTQPKPERFTLLSAVALILLDKNNNILLLRRHGTGFYDGYYSMVAGCKDADETLIDAVIREAQEEANIILKPEWLRLASVTHRKNAHRPGEKADTSEAIDFVFISTQWEGVIVNNEPHKHDELRFFPVTQLPQPMLPFAQLSIENALQGINIGFHGW